MVIWRHQMFVLTQFFCQPTVDMCAQVSESLSLTLNYFSSSYSNHSCLIFQYFFCLFFTKPVLYFHACVCVHNDWYPDIRLIVVDERNIEFAAFTCIRGQKSHISWGTSHTFLSNFDVYRLSGANIYF